MNPDLAATPLSVDVQIADDGCEVPGDADWQAWIGAALSGGGRDASGVVTVRLVAEDESAALNSTYRNKSEPTNVLAFPGPGDELTRIVSELGRDAELGDLVICWPVARREADEQGKHPVAHLAHLVVHGTLHLMGYDHSHETDAEMMESLEVRILDGLGFANPYAEPKPTGNS